MATTTNYGWTTPDDTALVKDGASAIRTLGSSVDTSVKALNPGTTAGDLDYYTAATTKSRIAIGTNGQVLTSNGSVPSWATPSVGGMTLLSTTSLSGATVTIGSISQSYKSLFMVIYGVTNATATGNFRIYPNNVSTGVWTSGLTGPTGNNNNNSYIRPTGSTNQTLTDANNSYQITIHNYTSTTNYKSFISSCIFTDANPATAAAIYAGGIATNTAITSLVFSNSGGNLSTGTVLLYGVN